MFNHTNTEKQKYNYITLLAMLYVTTTLTSVVLAYRTIAIGPFIIPGGTVIFPLSYFLGDVVAEVYGYKFSRQLIWFSVISNFIFASVIMIVIHLPAPTYLVSANTYKQVFSHTLRFVCSGTTGCIISSFVNIYIISKSKIYLHGKYFWLRSTTATAFGELTLTTIVALLTFIGIVPGTTIFTIIVSAFTFKIIYGLIAVWPATILASFLKRTENTDVYDFNTNFSPFSLKV